MINREKRERIRGIRILIADVAMAISVVAIVAVLVGVVAGWRFGDNMTLEQNGLVQINSKPSGAKITIDGEKVGSTDTSKMLTGGEHVITLTKDGYESWTKTITVTPGWLLNLQYPRLFKQGREKETVMELEGLSLLSVSPDRKSLVYALEDGVEWNFVTDLGVDKPKTTKVNLDSLVAEDESEQDEDAEDAEVAGTAPKTISVKNVRWNNDSDRVLVQTEAGEFLMVNLKNAKDSVNISEAVKNFKNFDELTRGFEKTAIQAVELIDNAGTELFVTISDSLFKLNLGEKSISQTTVTNISDFRVFDSKVIYVTKSDDAGLREIGMYKDGNGSAKLIFYTSEDESDALNVGLSEYYGQKYVIFTVGSRLYVYRGTDFASSSKDEMSLMAENDLWITPEQIDISHNGQYFVLREGESVVVYDAEVEKYVEYEFINTRSQWLDESMLYGVENGMLKAWDFDGTNVRTLVVDDAVEGFDATVTANDKYLYYVAKNGESFELRREKI